jgi:SAM-dependent methyltransferase
VAAVAVPRWISDETRVNSVVLERKNGPLIAKAARLWFRPGDLVVDVTFGKGNFWTHFEPQFFLAHDLKYDGVDFRALPYDDGVFDVVVLDPPYISPGGRETSTITKFNDAYGLKASPATPLGGAALMAEGIKEGARVLRPGGRLLVKCANYISGGEFFPGRHLAVVAANHNRLVQVDEFIHASGPGPQPKFNLDGSTRRQVHSRLAHSFLLVFERRKA